MSRFADILLVGILLVGLAIPTGRAQADEPRPLDFRAWQELPVLHEGRIKPLDSFARAAVRAVCGREDPRLAPPEGEFAPEVQNQLEVVFPGGKPRGFTAPEMLLSWLVEPEKWEDVPFLCAENVDLRVDLLGLPARGPEGEHLKYVSPRALLGAEKFWQRLEELRERQRQAQQERTDLSLIEVDKKARQLGESYQLYRMIAFNPLQGGAMQGRFSGPIIQAMRLWQSLREDLQPLTMLEKESDQPTAVAKASDAVQRLHELFKEKDPASLTLGKAEPVLAALAESMNGLADELESIQKRVQESPAGKDPPQKEQVVILLRGLASRSRDMARLVQEAHLGLYDSGRSLAVVPALNPQALEKNRNPDDDIQPWLSFQSVIFGSDALLREYPKRELAEVRDAFQETAVAYLSRGKADRPERFAAAMRRFARSVRQLGEAIEPLRADLPVRNRDEELTAATAYPPPGSTRLEVSYNRLAPFRWTWILSLAAVGCFLLTPLARRAMFWCGMTLAIAALGFDVAGLAIRSWITGRAPVTNMFETVVFVACVVTVLGLWFTVLPLLSRGLQLGWRLTAIPGTWEATRWEELGISPQSVGRWSAANLVLLLPRAGLSVVCVVLFALSGYLGLARWKALNASVPTASDAIVWIASLGMCAIVAWFLPRAILTFLTGVGLVPYALSKEGLRKPLDQVVAREPFALVGAAVAFLAAYVASNTSAFDENINPLMPVLRNNFWLTSHVLTITASYGAGALAWGLANVALGYYLFGRYRDPENRLAAVVPEEVQSPAGDLVVPDSTISRRPPEVCGVLAGFIYKATQVAVVLLAAGTILGALWADVSWGRFWGWDSKEVWALVSLLVYLAVLHGRYAGIFGNFGLAVGSVVGATSILAAWYGVNFVFGTGLHSYGTGTGGKIYVAIVVGVNWLFTAAAAIRYLVETQQPVPAAGGWDKATAENG